MTFCMPFIAVLSFAFVGFLAYVATRPSQFSIERKRSMKLDPEAVFALVNDFRRWERWSPWENLDPSQQRNYSGADAGVGAKYHWLGNKKVGEGRMEITESSPERIVIDLHFIKPFEAHNTTVVSIAREAEGVTVTWRMEGSNGFMSKAFGVFVDMDKMVGADFEKGLASIESVAKASAAKSAAAAMSN